MAREMNLRNQPARDDAAPVSGAEAGTATRDVSARRLALRLTPQGHLVCEAAPDAPDVDEAVATRLDEAFRRGSGQGLIRLGAGEVGQALPPVFVWWRNFAARYVTAVCLHGAGEPATGAAAAALPDVPAPDEGELASLVLTAPMMV